MFILAISDNMKQAGLIMLVTTAETCKPLDLTSHIRSPAGKTASATQPHLKSATDTGLNDESEQQAQSEQQASTGSASHEKSQSK